MELRNITADDMPLWEAMQCDPEMMAHIGGPQPRERIPEIFQKNLDCRDAGTCWVFKVMADEDPEIAAGSVVIWESEFRDEPINEMGWMILTAFQGKGLGGRAVRAILDKARLEGRWDVVHAFPPTSNGPSNGICRKLGFSWVEKPSSSTRDGRCTVTTGKLICGRAERHVWVRLCYTRRHSFRCDPRIAMMRNFQLLDTVETEADTGIIHFLSGDALNSPRLALRREGDYLSLSASYGALELALRLHFEDVRRALSRLQPVAGLQTTRTVGSSQSSLALGAQPDGGLLLRIMLVADAAGHLSLNAQLDPAASAVLRAWFHT